MAIVSVTIQAPDNVRTAQAGRETIVQAAPPTEAIVQDE